MSANLPDLGECEWGARPLLLAVDADAVTCGPCSQRVEGNPYDYCRLFQACLPYRLNNSVMRCPECKAAEHRALVEFAQPKGGPR